ncbi:hypothetical protein CR513_42663, partial [Mucuna pruriens]
MNRFEVESFAEGGKWVRNPHARRFTMVRCGKKEQVCHAAKEGEESFIYMYEMMFLDLGVTLPFDFFEADIHYTTRVEQSVGWVSIAPLPNTSLFTSYTASYKGFKSRFVKIKAVEAGYFCVDPRPLPLYWREPLKFKGLVRGQLSLEAKVDL